MAGTPNEKLHGVGNGPFQTSCLPGSSHEHTSRDRTHNQDARLPLSEAQKGSLQRCALSGNHFLNTQDKRAIRYKQRVLGKQNKDMDYLIISLHKNKTKKCVCGRFYFVSFFGGMQEAWLQVCETRELQG